MVALSHGMAVSQMSQHRSWPFQRYVYVSCHRRVSHAVVVTLAGWSGNAPIYHALPGYLPPLQLLSLFEVPPVLRLVSILVAPFLVLSVRFLRVRVPFPCCWLLVPSHPAVRAVWLSSQLECRMKDPSCNPLLPNLNLALILKITQQRQSRFVRQIQDLLNSGTRLSLTGSPSLSTNHDAAIASVTTSSTALQTGCTI